MPYELGPEFLAELFSKHAIDVVVHGDDPCLLPDGTDAYAYAKKQARALQPPWLRSSLRCSATPQQCCKPAAARVGSKRVWYHVQGRFRMIKRTEGVSSTDIVGRMLMCTRDNARFREARNLLSYIPPLHLKHVRPDCCRKTCA